MEVGKKLISWKFPHHNFFFNWKENEVRVFFKRVDLWSMTRFYLFVCFLSISSKQIPCAIWRSINSKSHKCEIRDDVKCQCYKHKPFLLLLMNYYTDPLLRPPTFLKTLCTKTLPLFGPAPMSKKSIYIFVSRENKYYCIPWYSNM